VDPHVANLLGEVLERLQRSPDRRDALRALADAVRELLPCAATVVWAQSARHRALKPRAGSPALPTLDEDAAAHVEPSVVEARLSARSSDQLCLTITSDDGDDLAPLRVAFAARTTDHVVALPLVHRGRVEGVVACLVGDDLVAEQIAAWKEVSPYVATILNASRLHESSAMLRSYRSHFATLGAEVLTAPNVETTAVRICELTRALFATTRSALFLLEGEDLVPVAAAGPYGDRAAGGTLHVPPGVEPVFDEALRTRQVVVINEFRSSPYAATPIPLPFRPQAAMVMPLTDGTGTIGLLTASELDDPHRFAPDAAENGRLFSAAATVAMRRMLLLEELQRAGRAKDDFLATVSHELRTPINVVLGYVQLLIEQAFGPMSAEQGDTVRRIERGARSLLGLVDDLLDLAGIERGAITCDLRAVSLGPLLDELGDATRALIGTRPIRFSSDIAGNPIAVSDLERLRQVLLNVLGNAVKFTARGSIELRARNEDGRIVLEVADTGSGMEPGFVGRATEPFVRGETSTGSGLGLAIVSRMLRLLDGTLAIDSRPGAGTTVRIVLPAANASALDLSDAS
jgi:signal transduction histidine kinase